MILRTVTLLCCVFLQHVAAESTRPTVWDLFNWQVTLQRQRQDEITVRGLIEASVAQDDVKIPGATCNETEEWAETTGLPGFVMNCKCNLNCSTFVPEIMSCMANSEIKQGCQFTSGSWSWRTSWRWDTEDDVLIVLDKKHDYGITTAMNASTREYQSCSVESLLYWEENMKWTEASLYFFNYSKPAMFKLNNMWHLSWNIKDLQNNVKKSLKGKILKFQIECEKPGPPQNVDEELEITSCLLVKVTGKFNVTSKYWDSRNTTVKTEARPKSDQDSLLIPLLMALSVIVLIVGILIATCYIRHIACFAEGRDLRHVTVLDDDVVQTKLIKNPADESTV